MEQEVLVKDIIPYIQIWTGFIIVILTALAYHIWHFGKEHPEIFCPDTTAEDKQMLIRKAEFRRQYNNKSMLSICVIFIWVIGMVAICFGLADMASNNQGWFILAFAIFGILWILSFLQRKPRQ